MEQNNSGLPIKAMVFSGEAIFVKLLLEANAVTKAVGGYRSYTREAIP